jgi:hypothetical protein
MESACENLLQFARRMAGSWKLLIAVTATSSARSMFYHVILLITLFPLGDWRCRFPIEPNIRFFE